MTVYLDNSATTRQYNEVTELQYRMAMENYGNPSSLHVLGFNASNILKDARADISKLLPPGGRVIFTSGGTESDNMALISSARKMRRRGSRIITTKVEHPAVLETCRRLSEDGFEIVYLDVDSEGSIIPSDLEAALTEDTILVSVMTVNNESGTIEPVCRVSRMIRDHNRKHGTGIIFHTDAVQAFGKIHLSELDADLIAASGHKFHGPKGMGLLFMKDNIKLPPFITGGGQENGYRSSTENVPGIAGMALAARMSAEDMQDKMSRMAELNDHLRKCLTDALEDVRLNGPERMDTDLSGDAGSADSGSRAVSAGRCPAVLNLTFAGTRGEVLLHTLEQDGVYVSTGSACSSHKTGDSHVLSAMGLDHKQIEGAVRFSLSEFNTREEIEYAAEKTIAAVRRFRKLGSFR